MRIVRAALSALVILFLALSPRPLLAALGEDPMTRLFEPEQPDWYGVIELWHIAEFRPYQGSVTKFLRERCEAFCRAHPGVHIEVTGLTNKMFEERIARGVFPDAYSFPAGFLYRERLQALSFDVPPLRGNLRPAASEGAVYAAPYLMSGYFLLINEQLQVQDAGELPEAVRTADLQRWLSQGMLSIPPVAAAYLGLSGESREYADFLAGKITAAVADARSYGDLTRDTDANLLVAALPMGGYTEQTLYLGAAADTDAHRAALIAELYAYLLSDEVQQRLPSLGAMPVKKYMDNVAFSFEGLDGWYAAYADAVTPDPFALERHGAALAEEALLAMRGTPGGREAFLERMAVVLAGEN